MTCLRTDPRGLGDNFAPGRLAPTPDHLTEQLLSLPPLQVHHNSVNVPVGTSPAAVRIFDPGTMLQTMRMPRAPPVVARMHTDAKSSEGVNHHDERY